jgi:FKBP-type peptidyl-prolyl cis-trans isomerase FkpA
MRVLVFALSLVLVSCSSTPDSSTEKAAAPDKSTAPAATPNPATPAPSAPSGPATTDSRAYIEKAMKEPGARMTTIGSVYKELTPGKGPSPKPTDMVKVHYRGTFMDGTEFDSSYKRGQPSEFGLNRVIRCWTDGLQMMKVGGKSRLVCPSDTAYGDNGRPGIPGGATLVFEVELLGIGGA